LGEGRRGQSGGVYGWLGFLVREDVAEAAVG
jgi:hypothetical protein